MVKEIIKFAGSSNGRTHDSGSCNLGPNPSPAAKINLDLLNQSKVWFITFSIIIRTKNRLKIRFGLKIRKGNKVNPYFKIYKHSHILKNVRMLLIMPVINSKSNKNIA